MLRGSDLRIGIDIGGTFTDFVIFDAAGGTIQALKLPSTPANPAEAVLQGLASILSAQNESTLDPVQESPPKAPRRALQLVHGSTVATNALLERKGAETALLTTRGFGDILQIGRQNRPHLYDLSAGPPPALIPAGRRFEIDERVGPEGQVIRPLEPAQLDEALANLQASGVESVAICLLFSFLHPEHEQVLASRLREAGYAVSVSSEILPEYREFERMSTTAVNAYVTPTLDRYLALLEKARLGERVGAATWRVMQSNGGNISLGEARRAGVRCILSGPAGGLIGARQVADRARLITFDMGGTSTDVSLIDGVPALTTEAVVGGCPIRIPVLDIHTIGAGGGSIASVDPGGALRVGPESAGAEPGPACYGRGDLASSRPTVTDANLMLGRIAPEFFLGGRLQLDPNRARTVLARLGEALGLAPEQAALGVIEVANAHMERALRLISVERGHDPGDFTLLSFGGAGGLHAADLARRLHTPHVLVPPLASTLSAFGMLAADVVKDYTQTVMLPGDTPYPAIARALAPMLERGRAEIMAEGVRPGEILVEPSLDIRYRGQSYELNVPFGDTFAEDYHQAHRGVYGYDRQEAPLEIVNLRVRATGRVTSPRLPEHRRASADPGRALINRRRVLFPAGWEQVPFYRGEALQAGNLLSGPAVVARADTTILIGPADRAEVDSHLNLSIMIGF
jgi:N-methylhydantoinase A